MVPVDVQDAAPLDEFCRASTVVINCAEPVALLQDRAAQAAWRQHCHYVDASGMSLVKERLAPHRSAIEQRGLSFVISAGWMPGLSELMPT